MKTNKRVLLTVSAGFTKRNPEMEQNSNKLAYSYMSTIQNKRNMTIGEVGYVFLNHFQLDRAISLAKLLSSDACVANVSLAPFS